MRSHPLRVIALVLASIVLLGSITCVVTASRQPSSFRIAREREIALTPDAIRSVVTDVERFERAFSVGPREDREPVVVLSEQRVGRGAYFERVLPGGRTRFTIAEDGAERVAYEVTSEDAPSTRFVIDLAPRGAATAVTVAIEGRIDTFLQKALWPFVGLEARLAPELDRTLEAIEAEARGTPAE